MSFLFHYKHYELAFFSYSTSLKIRLLDPKNARCFESEFSDSSSQSLSKSLCLTANDLFSLIQRALTNPSELLSVEIMSFGAIAIKIILQFPIEKHLDFTISLKELELNDFRKGMYQLQDLEARIGNIEAFFKKEELRIRKNSHFPSFEPQSILSCYTFSNKRKTAIKKNDAEGELLEGTRMDKNDHNFMKFSVVFKGKKSLINGFIGVGVEKEAGVNKKGSYIMGTGVVYWDGTMFNTGSMIRNHEEISVIINEGDGSIRWENKEGEKLFEGKTGRKQFNELLRPLVGASNEGTSVSFL